MKPFDFYLKKNLEMFIVVSWGPGSPIKKGHIYTLYLDSQNSYHTLRLDFRF